MSTEIDIQQPDDQPAGPIEQQAVSASGYTPAPSQNGLDLAQIPQALQTQQPVFLPKTTIVDSVALSRAQGRFINAQTKFLMQTAPYGSSQYVDALSVYSRAQTELITAMQTTLHQADII